MFYLATSALSAAAFAGGWLVARRTRRGARAAAVAALALILAKAVLNARPVWEAALFPHPWYVFLQDWWLYPAGMTFFGLAVPQLPVRWNRALVAGAGAALFAWSLWAGRWMLLPPDDSSLERAGTDHFCRQTTRYTCAPASCAALLSHWGIQATEGEMARLCLTGPQGTTLFNVFRGLVLKLRRGGSPAGPLAVRILELSPGQLRALDVPALAGGAEHAVVIRFDGETPVLLDPMNAAGPRPARDATVGLLLANPVVVLLPEGGGRGMRPWRR